jgi:hypothetical protein
MFYVLETRRPAHEFRKEKSRRRRKVIKTTLGDLIAAIMDEVASLVRDPLGRQLVTSYVLNDVLVHHQRRVAKRSERR